MHVLFCPEKGPASTSLPAACSFCHAYMSIADTIQVYCTAYKRRAIAYMLCALVSEPVRAACLICVHIPAPTILHISLLGLEPLEPWNPKPESCQHACFK